MSTFRYNAINRAGQSVNGHIEADSAASAKARLADDGLFAAEIKDNLESLSVPATPVMSTKFSALRVSRRQRAELLGQLATALKGQLPLLVALDVVGQQSGNGKVKRLLDGLGQIVRSGQSLSSAMSHYPNIFDRLAVSIVAVGEHTGRLDQSIWELAQISDKDMQNRSNIITAAMYPVFVLAIGAISLVVIITYIMPRILDTLAADVDSLPWPSRVVMALSSFMQLYGWLVALVLIVMAVVAGRVRSRPLGRYVWDRFVLSLPILGTVRRTWAVSRFARTLGTLAFGGVNILDALQIVAGSVGNHVAERHIKRVVEKVRAGQSLAQTLKEADFFPPLLVQIVGVGEQTGDLAEQLLVAAEAFDRDTNIATKRFMAIFPAILILILALVVGFIVAATLLPIVQIETAVPGL